jgi:DNA polymerase-3 subunit beta
MKIIVERAALLKALAHVQSAVEKRNTIPILANVLMEASGDTLKLTTTDMEIAVVEDVTGAHVSRPGRITAPAAMLYEIARKLPDGAKVEIEHSASRFCRLKTFRT